jgi:hypothetical protein
VTLSERQRQLAAEALHHAIAEDYAKAAEAVNALGNADAAAIPQMLLAWIDTTLIRTGFTPGSLAGRPAIPGWVAEGTDQVITDADQVSPTQRLAGRLFNARVNDDQQTFEALLDAIPDIETWRGVCAQVLNGAASTIRSARQGRPVGFQRLPVDRR